MALEDRTAFEDIRLQFELTPNETVLFMRSQLKPSSFRLWRKRVAEHGQLKNRNKMRDDEKSEPDRFKCRTQRSDGSIKNRK
ncbi:MAG: TIGR03643 family protein [Cryobacterium sp.]|nr:TIGR03643 family protein [Oligoflexia bacterium]